MTPFATTFLVVLAGLSGSTDDGKKTTKPVVTIKCYADAVIRGTEIRLSDVADVECKDARLAAQLSQLRIAGRPTHRYHRTISQRDLLTCLRRERVPATFIFTGAESIVAQSLSHLVTVEEIVDIAENTLDGVLDANFEDVDIERTLQSKVVKMHVPPGRNDMHLEAKLRGGKIGPHTATIDVTIFVDGKAFKKKSMNYRLNRFAEMLVAKRRVKRGELLSQANVKLERMPIGSGVDLSLRSFDSIFDRVASTPINKGVKILEGHLARPALIHANQPVTLVIKSKRIRVTLPAVALRDGALGDTILVRKLSGGDPIQGLVYGRNTVLIPTGR